MLFEPGGYYTIFACKKAWRLPAIHRRAPRAMTMPRRSACMAAMGEVLQMPRRARGEHDACELQNAAIEKLVTIKYAAGDEAFDKAARRLIAAIAAILARERGNKHVADFFAILIERVLPAMSANR
jgi:hypothetical protein